MQTVAHAAVAETVFLLDLLDAGQGSIEEIDQREPGRIIGGAAKLYVALKIEGYLLILQQAGPGRMGAG